MESAEQLPLFVFELAGSYDPKKFWGWAPPKQTIDDVGDEEYVDD